MIQKRSSSAWTSVVCTFDTYDRSLRVGCKVCIPEVGRTALDESNGPLASILRVVVHDMLMDIMQAILSVKHSLAIVVVGG